MMGAFCDHMQAAVTSSSTAGSMLEFLGPWAAGGHLFATMPGPSTGQQGSVQPSGKPWQESQHQAPD